MLKHTLDRSESFILRLFTLVEFGKPELKILFTHTFVLLMLDVSRKQNRV